MSNLIIQDLSDIAPYVDGKADAGAAPTPKSAGSAGGSTDDRVTGFVQEYLPVAQKVASRTGVEPHVLLGQWGLETGWGKSVIPGSRNLGNIKRGSSWKGRTVDATDNATGSRDPYRAYDDDDGFANDFADLLERRYRNALNYGDNAAGYFNALKSGGYAEDPGYVNKGISAARMARAAIGSVPSASAGPAVNPDDYARRGDAPSDRGALDGAKDSALALGSGVVRGVGMIAGAFGADNPVARGADEMADGLMDRQSESRKAQRANRAEIIRQAEESGSTWEEIKANIGAFAEAPIETSLGAIGTSAPTILVSLIPGLGQATAARLILQGAVSAAQGAGSVKGSIYEAVERKMIESGHDADTAAKVAAGAQAYDGINGGQIALGAALGVAAGTTGIERSVAGMMGAAAPGKKLGVLSRALLGAAKEAPTEGAQGGQERFAANQALINQGFDVDPWAGVAGQAAGEAVAAAGPGGVFGALDTSKPAAPAPAPAAAPGQTPGPAAQQPPAGTPPGGAGEAPAQPAAAAPVDKVGARATEIEQQVRADGLLEKLRSIGQPGRTAGEFLDALAVAKNPNIDPSVRQQALESLEMALGWIRDGAMPNDPATGKPFSTELSVQPAPREPGTDLAPRSDAPVAPAGMGEFFDPNVVDVDAVRVDNMIGGPRAIDPPRARLAAPNEAELGSESEADVEQPSAADDQPAVDAAGEAPVPAGPDGRVDVPADAETTARRLVELPKVAVPAGAEPAVQRREAAQIKVAVEAGFDTVERRDDGVYLVHSGRNQESKLSGLGAMVRARKIIADTMAARANEAASSPLNDLEQPTEAQAKAGNYRKGAARLNGFAISIENPRDSVRSGTSPDGKKWESKMAHHYGYIKGSVGADGDQVDVFIGQRPDLDTVFVVDQVDPATGEFDEHKVMMGFKSLEDARAGYLANYEPGWKGMASITEMPLSTFRKWVRSPAARLPASQYDPRSSNGEQDGQQSDDRAGGSGLGEELRRQDGVGQGLGEVDGEWGGEARQRQDAAVSGGSGRAAAQQGDRDPRPAGRDQASDAVAIEALAAVERDGRQVKIEAVDPADPRAQAANDLLDAFERLTGHRAIPVIVTGPDAFDGVQLGENTFVNIDGLEQSLAWTVGHEFKHLSDRLPGLAKLYDRIWDLIPTSARAKYLPYLHQTRQVSTNQLSLATPTDLAKLKDEMVADFMGQRFNDKAWLQQLAQQKPALFGNFVRDWVKVLNSLIGELQVLLGIRGGRGAAGKDIDALLSGYIDQLEEAKAIAIEVAAVWAERNPKLAQVAGIGARTGDPKFSAREEFPSLDPDSLDGELEAMLQEELEAELANSSGEVGMPDSAAIKAAGLMAEDAFPELYWQDEDREGIRETVRIPDLYREGKTAVIDVEQMGQDGLWGAQMQTTWVGPGAGEREGYVSIGDAKDFVQRQVAAVMLHKSGYDLLQTAPSASVRRAVAGWKAIGEIGDDGINPARRYKSPTSKTASLKDLAVEMGLDEQYDVIVNVDTPFPGETIYNISLNSKTSDQRYGALLTIISNGNKKHMSVNTIELARSGMGGAVYQLVSEFAARRGIPLMPESSISGVNTYRRTEQMISAALRTGKSNVMVPHETQRIYGFHDKASTREQHDDNLGRLVLASLRNAVELAPEVMDLRYHPHTGIFTMEDGSDAERLVAEILSRTETRAFGLGRAQLARAALTREMMSGKLKAEKIESFAAPVLYSARETAAAEYQAVVDQHMGKATWMKAPNGQPTKLTERQWVQVRTPSFKRWFGDWEAFALRDGGVWSDGEGAVSKAVHPETGEPLVIYHGTDKGGFFEFNTPSGERRGDLGIFTTDDYDMARSYVRRGRVQDFTPPASQDELEEAGFQFEETFAIGEYTYRDRESAEEAREDGDQIESFIRVFDTDGYELDGPADNNFRFSTMEQAVAAAAESFSGTDSVAMVYAGFINLRSPHESDFEGALFNGSRDHQWVVEVGGEIQSDSDGKQYFSDKDEAAEFAKMFVADDDDGADPYDYVRAADEHYETTDGVVREARSIGADGAIIRRVIDDGGGPGAYAGEPRDVFVALKPGQIKSAEWNTGEFGDVDDLRYSKRVQDAADGDRTDVSKLPPGKPVPASLAVGSLEQALQVARAGKYAKGRDLKVDLQRRVQEASAAAGIDLTERTQETHKFLAGMVRRDAEFALKDNQNAVGWYDSKVSRALGALATLHPEIESNPEARLAFLWALATTSNGLKVNKNFELAEVAYQGWKSTGRMPDNVGIGNAAQQINRGLAAFNSLSDKLGAERLAKFMSTEFGAGEIERMLGVPVGGEWKSTPVRGAAILGPKIGNGFFSNLNGYFGALTMDRWLMRTWGRMTGTLIEVDQKMVKASRARLADRIAAMDDAQRRLMTQLVRAPIKRRMTIAELDAAAGSTAVATMKVNIREQMMANPKTDEFRRAALNHQVQIDGQKEIPAGPGERNWIRAVFHKALGDLNEAGISMTMSDLQALLWYPERRLYDTAKAADEIDQGYSDDEAPDYANAAMALALANGADLKDVMAAMDRAEKRGTVRGEQLTEAERAAMLKEFRSAPKQPMQMAFEVAPDPADNAAIDAWGQLTTKERTQITSSVRDDVLSDIAALVGVPLQKVAPATGGYMGLVNPSLIAEYQKTKVSLEQARALASAIGYVLDQDSVALMDPRVESKAGLIRITFSGKVEPHAHAIYEAIHAAVPEVDAFTARGNNFDILNFTGLSNEDLSDLVVDALAAIDIPLEGVASFGDVHSELVEKGSYENHLQGARPGSGSEIRTGVDWLRDRARKAVKGGIRKALDARRPRLAAAARLAVDPEEPGAAGGARQRGSGATGNRGGRSVARLSARGSLAAPEPADAQEGLSQRLAPLPGAPNVAGFHGPDPRLVDVAEAYARGIGITLRRQSEYVQVDEERARRIAQAYEAMEHAPKDPAVKEAYQNLIRQTRAQYDALVAAGYRFWFTDLSVPSNVEYLSTPWNAMRDIRANQVMGVFPTEDGFGSSDEFDPANNPLLEDTGLTWPNGGLDGAPKRVLANDLFRAVHDAFGHGLEGAGFRAQGEENAWQAHARLFTGSALGAITSETRGQNSWLNYGPNGESNRTAKVEETVFADQKTGLMPSWTWSEGVAGDMGVESRRPAFSARTPGELFFSELANQIEKSTMKQAAAGAWKSFIKALPSKGVKADEIEWTGINEWLDLQGGKVSRDAVLDYLRANGVQVQEVTLDGKIKNESLGRRQQLALEYDAAIEAAMAADVALNPQYIEGLRPEDRKPQEQALLDAWVAVSENPEEDHLVDRNPEPKYGQYTLPGGENYREVLLTLPAPETGDQILARLKKKYPDWKEGVSYRDVLSASDQAAFEASLDAVYGGKAFRSSHWDQLNVLAHIRVNDRTDAEGRKVLFVEELQSDFAQDFRKSRKQVEEAVEKDFLGIVERMQKAGVLQVDCD